MKQEIEYYDDWGAWFSELGGVFFVNLYYKGKVTNTIGTCKTFAGTRGLWQRFMRHSHIRSVTHDGEFKGIRKWNNKKNEWVLVEAEKPSLDN